MDELNESQRGCHFTKIVENIGISPVFKSILSTPRAILSSMAATATWGY